MTGTVASAIFPQNCTAIYDYLLSVMTPIFNYHKHAISSNRAVTSDPCNDYIYLFSIAPGNGFIYLFSIAPGNGFIYLFSIAPGNDFIYLFSIAPGNDFIFLYCSRQ